MRAVIIFLLAALWALPAHAERRVALVIGNSAYEHVPQLANPKNDAADMAKKLEELGFEVVFGENLDLMGMRTVVREFVDKIEGADLSLFFYAGHGLQVNGANYMAPTDAKLASYNHLDFEAFPMDLVLSAMERSTKVNLVFLDACRDNPLAENLARSMGTRSSAVGRGLAKLGSGVGSLIAFATQPGNVALDGDGRNSPFTTALLNHLGTPGQSVTDDLIQVRKEVLDATAGKQVPWDNSSLTGPVILKEKPKEEPKVELAPAAEAKAPQPDNSVEITFWNSIKDSGNPSYFEAYLQQYPTGAFGALAKVKLAELKAQQEQAEADAKAKLEADAKAKAEAEKQKAIETAKLEQPTASETANDLAPIDPAELALATQKELARIGCLSGKADGKWGSGSERALKDYTGRQGIELATLQPSAEILGRLKATTVRVCPLVCDKGLEEKNGRCEKVKQEAKVEPKPEPKEKAPATTKNEQVRTKSASTGQVCYQCRWWSDRFMKLMNETKCFANEAAFRGWTNPTKDICRRL
jgi:uncharacterized caspase-like protein